MDSRHHRGISLGKNPGGTLTYSNLDISTLVLHEATLLEVCPDTNMSAPLSGIITHLPFPGAHGRHLLSTWWLQNYSTSAQSTQEFFLNPSVLYHPVQDNRMADDASRLFKISDTPFLAHISATYLQLQILWRL